MSDTGQSMEKYNRPFSEQAEYAPDWHPVGVQETRFLADGSFTPAYRNRVVIALIQNAAWRVGGWPPGLTFREKLLYILKHATRSRAISPTQYKVVWFLAYEVFKDHVIIDNVTNPIIAGDSA